MKTWLLTWNPEKFAWDSYQEKRNEFSQVGTTFEKWNCGKNRSIQKGDRLFLMKVNSFPKGIIASGYAASNVFKSDDNHMVYICFDCIYDDKSQEILSIQSLKKIADFNWLKKTTGTQIPYPISEDLEKKWKELDSLNFMNSFGKEYVLAPSEFSNDSIPLDELLNQYGFEKTKENEKINEFQNKNSKEIVYTLNIDCANVIVHPDTYLKGYNGSVYFNRELSAFPENEDLHFGIKYEFEHEFEMELFLSAFSNQCTHIDINHTWLMSVNPNHFDHYAFLKKHKCMYSRQVFHYEVGDTILLYSSSPAQRIMALCKVKEINLDHKALDDSQYWYSQEDKEKDDEYGHYFCMELVHFIDNDLLSFENLKEHGLKNAPQCAMKLKKELYQYIFYEARI